MCERMHTLYNYMWSMPACEAKVAGDIYVFTKATACTKQFLTSCGELRWLITTFDLDPPQ